MAWPTHQVNGFVPSSTEWNAIVDALSTAQGPYNGNGQVASGWLQINITPTANANALQIAPIALISAGTQIGGMFRQRANSYDTSNHTRDFFWQATTSSNAGAGYLALSTSLDGGGVAEVLRYTSAGQVSIGMAPFVGVLFQVHTGVDQNFCVRNNSGLEILSINDAGSTAGALAINATFIHLNGPGALVPHTMTAPGTPPSGQFYFYMDTADNKLKAKGPSGTVTVLALP